MYILNVIIKKNMWKVTEDWVRMIYDAHFKISDIEKIFGENNNILFKNN